MESLNEFFTLNFPVPAIAVLLIGIIALAAIICYADKFTNKATKFLGETMLDEYTSVKQWIEECKPYGEDPLLIARLRENGFTQSQILDILNVYASVCGHCYDEDSDCQCWNDE